MSEMAAPYRRFAEWLADAQQCEPNNPTAMSVATVGPDGRPSSRVVLLRGYDDRGFVFYTNFGSRKIREWQLNPFISLCFHWKSLDRQVRIEGRAEQVSDEEADAYFASRPRDSQIGAWASRQSEVLAGRFELEARVAKYAARFGLGKVPRPAFWSGVRVVPDAFEFWAERPFRLHDRESWRLVHGTWQSERLFP